MGTTSKIIFLAFFFHSAACSGGKFSGQTDAGAAEPGQVESTSGTVGTGDASGNGSGNAGPVAGCDKNAVGITQAKLLSNGISTQLGTQTLRYELSVLNCKDGSVQSLKDQPILFDLDASLATGFQPVAYAVLDTQGMQISASILQVVTGSDLFGNTGNFAHWTTQNFSYSSQLEKLILEIKLENIQVLPRNEADTQIKSFLRIGSAQAVTQPLNIIN
ncbi:MAG TPA: hypothetical protein VFO10_17035 [Oligoflexus sp.]|uniref:hypothetical protein n=1 Tax=Oligoflexus sp. TaxID=1971216 RepID=UPI002D8076AF|nr:hypothetical protein [Oligoflexus sp.]HET9238966.1 hypothetical protein [Oligoflexus sp.]